MNCQLHYKDLSTQLKKSGLKTTTARLAVMDIFKHTKKPFSINEIKKLLPKSHHMDTVTVYRNINSLVQMGFLKKLRIKDGENHYELAESGHHHHLSCVSCGKIVDIENCTVSKDFSGRVLTQLGFKKIFDHTTEFYGLCKKCS